MLSSVLPWLASLGFAPFMALLALANALMYLGSCGTVLLLQRAFPQRLLNRDQNAPLSWRDILLSLGIALLNTLIAVPGWWLWKAGVIVLSEPPLWRMVLDFLFLLVYFDTTMYFLHRLMHTPLLYRLSHARHHEHHDVTGISLYVMHPIEALGFGALLLVVLCLKPTALWALLVFLVANWTYGTLGHSGLRFESPLLRWVAGDSGFHHTHHQHGQANYGFFTPFWDRLCHTKE